MNVHIIYPDSAIQDDDNHACVGWLSLLGQQFDSVESAEAFIDTQVEDYTVDTHFIVQPVGHWIACAKDVSQLSNVETISSSSNINPSKGRHGSVDEVRQPVVKAAQSTQTPQKHPAVTAMPQHEKKREINDHVARIESLINDVPDEIVSDIQYANARHHLASLRAYLRSLDELLQEASTKREAVEKHILKIDDEYNEFRYQWRQQYNTAMKESGFDVTKDNGKLSVIQFLDIDV